MSKEVVINVDNVKQHYKDVIALDGVSMTINKGEIIGFLGPSGSGKTTLVKAMIGMYKPTDGQVSVLGVKVPSLSVVNHLGYMAQSDALYEDISAYDNLIFFAALYGFQGKKAKIRAEEVLELVRLNEHAKRPVRTFSGGMKRRLSLAIALMHKPEILILDEPTVGIDPVLRREFWNEFKKLKNMGTTIIVTTHVMDEADHCDRLALIRNGQLIALGTPEEIKKQSGEATIEGAFLRYSDENREVEL